MALPKLGKPAPDFTLLDQDGVSHTLSQYRSRPGKAGKWVLVYFYPRDNTTGCTAQACAIRDADEDFSALGAVVLGVSADSVASHKKFVEKYGLTFPLLADEKKKVVRAYGVWGMKKFMGREHEGIFRTSFLIDPKGVLVKIYEKVKPAEHAAMVLADLKALRA